jgi:hypothetical protein
MASIGIVTLIGVWAPVLAENRALLIGAGSYPKICNNTQQCGLPGIDVDLKTMQRVAQYLGFTPSQMKVLHDDQATYDNVKAAFHNWLFQGVTADDRVLIYFSGHGTHVPDEDGDEGEGNPDTALVLHDTEVVQRSGRETLAQALVDDDFGRWLARIPSINILVLVDACHSGDVYKSLLSNRSLGETEGAVKYFRYPNMPRSRGKSGLLSSRSLTRENFVAISAAGHDEKSIATPKGSLFTLGVDAAIATAVRQQAKLTVRDLAERSSAYVAQHTAAGERFHPQLQGNLELASQLLQLVAQAGGSGPTWQTLESTVDRASERLSIQSAQPIYRLGDRSISFTLEVPWAGYLNIVAVGPDDQPTVLFPNGFRRDNAVPAGRFVLPNPKPGQSGYRFEAQEPAGPTLVVAVLTPEPLDLYETSTTVRDISGSFRQLFAEFSMKGMLLVERSIRVVEDKRVSGRRVAAGKTVVRTE